MRRRDKNRDNTLIWLVALSSCLEFSRSASLVHIVVGDNLDPPNYPGQVANFGNQEPEYLFVPNLNLILPPADRSQLCSYPVEASELDAEQRHEVEQDGYVLMQDDNNSNETYMIVDEDDSHLIARENMSVALFVSYGDCLPSRKAKVALDLRRNFTRYGTVTHLVIYNNDFSNMDELHTLTSYMHDVDELSDMTIVYVSTRSGRDIMQIIKEEEQRQRFASPTLFAEGNELWYMPVSFLEPSPYEQYSGSGTGFSDIDPYNDNYDQTYPPPRQETGIPESDDFYWFRLIVFSLLVVSPCFRAAYLWYAGGARIRFRYNDQGRVVGLQYIPPMPYWFAPRPDENYTHPATRMTREQVLALPEIVFSGSTEGSDDNDNGTEPKQEAEPEEEPNATNPENGDPTSKGSSAQLHEGDSITASGTESSGIAPLAASSSEDEHIAIDEEQGRGVDPSEMHSTCSICIDDFEQGERLRMLPRCRHIFHTDCILPWLTERQGCCPLCKTEVTEPEHEEGSEHQSGDNADRTTPQLTDSQDVFRNEGQHAQTPEQPLPQPGASTGASPWQQSGDDG